MTGSEGKGDLLRKNYIELKSIRVHLPGRKSAVTLAKHG